MSQELKCLVCGLELTRCREEHKCDSRTETFIRDSRRVHGYRYNYTSTRVTENCEKVVISCHKHGLFIQTISYHLQGHGCAKCLPDECQNIEQLLGTQENLCKVTYLETIPAIDKVFDKTVHIGCKVVKRSQILEIEKSQYDKIITDIRINGYCLSYLNDDYNTYPLELVYSSDDKKIIVDSETIIILDIQRL